MLVCDVSVCDVSVRPDEHVRNGRMVGIFVAKAFSVEAQQLCVCCTRVTLELPTQLQPCRQPMLFPVLTVSAGDSGTRDVISVKRGNLEVRLSLKNEPLVTT